MQSERDKGLTVASGHSLQIVAGRKSVYVRNAPKATAGGQDVGRREGPEAAVGPFSWVGRMM
jgi:hypothetical protein